YILILIIFFNPKQNEFVLARNRAIHELGELYGIDEEIINNTIEEEKNAAVSIDLALKNLINILKYRNIKHYRLITSTTTPPTTSIMTTTSTTPTTSTTTITAPIITTL